MRVTESGLTCLLEMLIEIVARAIAQGALRPCDDIDPVNTRGKLPAALGKQIDDAWRSFTQHRYRIAPQRAYMAFEKR